MCSCGPRARVQLLPVATLPTPVRSRCCQGTATTQMSAPLQHQRGAAGGSGSACSYGAPGGFTCPLAWERGCAGEEGACQGLRAPCLPFPWVFSCFSSTWVPTVWHCDIRAPPHVPPRDLRALQREWGSGWRGRAPVFTERGCSGALVKPVCLLALSPVGPALKPPALRNLLCSALIVPGALHMQKGRGVACP